MGNSQSSPPATAEASTVMDLRCPPRMDEVDYQLVEGDDHLVEDGVHPVEGGDHIVQGDEHLHKGADYLDEGDYDLDGVNDYHNWCNRNGLTYTTDHGNFIDFLVLYDLVSYPSDPKDYSGLSHANYLYHKGKEVYAILV
jgi:hypothetical protein